MIEDLLDTHCFALSDKPVITLDFKMAHCSANQQTHLWESLKPHTSSIFLFETSGEKTAFVISNLSWMERQRLSHTQVKRGQKDRRSTPVASFKHVHAKCMVSHLHSLPSSVSHLPFSLRTVLLRDWAVGRKLQSSLFRTAANRRC